MYETRQNSLNQYLKLKSFCFFVPQTRTKFQSIKRISHFNHFQPRISTMISTKILAWNICTKKLELYMYLSLALPKMPTKLSRRNVHVEVVLLSSSPFGVYRYLLVISATLFSKTRVNKISKQMFFQHINTKTQLSLSSFFLLNFMKDN